MPGSVPGGEVPLSRRRLERAWQLYHGGRYELAADECRASLALESQDSEAHGLLAFCLAGLSRFEDALAAARESIRLTPARAWSHYAYGRVLRKSRRYRDAESALREAIRIAPEDADYREEVGWVLIDSDRNREALDAAREGRRMDPGRAGFAAIEGIALEALGECHAAESALRSALALDPDHRTAHAGMGYLALRRREGPKAAEAFQTALRLSPTYRWAETGMGDALRLLFPGYGRVEAIRSWIGARRLTAPGLAIGVLAFLFVVVCGGLYATSGPVFGGPGPYLAIIALFLVLLPYLWACAFWVLRPLVELNLAFHPVGRWLVSKERVRAGRWIAGLLGVGAILALGGWAFECTHGLLAGSAYLLAAPVLGARFREPPSPLAREEWILLILSLAAAVVPHAGSGVPLAIAATFSMWLQMVHAALLPLHRP